MEESGVPVQDDWSTAPEEDRVRFSLSGVTPHSWRDTEEGGEGQAPGKEWGHREGLGPPASGGCVQSTGSFSSVPTPRPWAGRAASQGRCQPQSACPAGGSASARAIQKLELR